MPYLMSTRGSDVHQIEAEVNTNRLGEHRFLGLTIPDVNINRMHQLIYYKNIFSCLAAVTKVMLTGPWP